MLFYNRDSGKLAGAVTDAVEDTKSASSVYSRLLAGARAGHGGSWDDFGTPRQVPWKKTISSSACEKCRW